jgi:hypothetical protein
MVAPAARPNRAPASGEPGALARFDPADRSEWWWRQPKWHRRTWRLETGAGTTAEIRGESFFTSKSLVRFAGADYVAHRSLFGHFTLKRAGDDEPVAAFASNWMYGGKISGTGDELEVAAKGFVRRAYELRTPDGFVIARFEMHCGLARTEVRVVLDDTARRRSDLAPLLALMAAVVFAPKRHGH